MREAYGLMDRIENRSSDEECFSRCYNLPDGDRDTQSRTLHTYIVSAEVQEVHPNSLVKAAIWLASPRRPVHGSCI